MLGDHLMQRSSFRDATRVATGDELGVGAGVGGRSWGGGGVGGGQALDGAPVAAGDEQDNYKAVVADSAAQALAAISASRRTSDVADLEEEQQHSASLRGRKRKTPQDENEGEDEDEADSGFVDADQRAEDETGLPHRGHQLREWTNVWGIGAIVIHLMNLDSSPSGPVFAWMQSAAPTVEDGKEARYSAELRALAKSCVAWEQGVRPCLRDLRADIQRLTHTETGLERMRGSRGLFEVNDGDGLLVIPEREEYKLGFAVDDENS